MPKEQQQHTKILPRHPMCKSVSNAKQRQHIKIFFSITYKLEEIHRLLRQTFGILSHSPGDEFACSSMDDHCCEDWSSTLEYPDHPPTPAVQCYDAEEGQSPWLVWICSIDK
jgi:hypothetical protein